MGSYPFLYPLREKIEAGSSSNAPFIHSSTATSRSRRLEIVRRYVDFYESTMDLPWSLENTDGEFIDKLLDAVVGFRIDIERIEGKWKLNQNHDAKRRTKTIRALREAGGEDREQIADMMSHTLKG